MNNLKDFATKIDTFLKGNTEQPEWFDSGCGLCSNLSNYMRDDFTNWQVLRNQLNSFLERWHVYDSALYPFNMGRDDYWAEVKKGTLYENKARLACIKGIINEN